ncbi:hypothetical protein ACIOHO_28335 [Streptomyces sp. NPDC087849]|uniref:hypothetical protein n=1 Tax=Streptomyces sp. NPDC087849 TaxID=3365808 RepID=UPI0038123909
MRWALVKVALAVAVTPRPTAPHSAARKAVAVTPRPTAPHPADHHPLRTPAGPHPHPRPGCAPSTGQPARYPARFTADSTARIDAVRTDVS